MRRMTATQLARYLDEAQPLLIDVREPWEFDICHIDGSRNLPMGRIPASLDAFDEAAEIVVICHHGIRSLQVANYLRPHCNGELINLDGGVDAWAREVDPSMPVY